MTSDDVFCLYERNLLYYHQCSNSHENCDTNYCRINAPNVLPYTIGDQTNPCSLSIRCYIKPGVECPICYDPILTKRSAFITNCGHPFHKHCIFKYFESKWHNANVISPVKCPMCRCILDYFKSDQRYRSTYLDIQYKDDSELDKLEDFWLTKDYKFPSFCSNKYNHYLGMCATCNICSQYRKHGDIMYEIHQSSDI